MIGQPLIDIDVRPLEQGEAERLAEGDIDSLIDRARGGGVIDRADEQKGPVLDGRGPVRDLIEETGMADEIGWAEEVRVRRERKCPR